MITNTYSYECLDLYLETSHRMHLYYMVYQFGTYSNSLLGYMEINSVEEVNLNIYSTWTFRLFNMYFVGKTFNYIFTDVDHYGSTFYFAAYLLPSGM